MFFSIEGRDSRAIEMGQCAFCNDREKLICSFITNFLELLLDNLFVQFPIRTFVCQA